MEGCLCAKCLNPHSLYNTIRRYIKDIPLSLSEYLTTFFECGKDRDLNFPKLECIQGSCKTTAMLLMSQRNRMIGPSVFLTISLSKNWSLSTTRKGIFHGINVQHARTTMYHDVLYHDVLLQEVYGLILSSAREYLVHRYHTILDNVFWQKFLNETTNPVTWIDYSVNVKLTEKQQAQSVHFSGKQQTLHDSLIQYPNKHFHYIYHISNDTNHDSVMTTQVVEGILMNHPKIIQSGRLSLRSDNCSTQYKSRYVFKSLLNIAEKYNIRIDFFMVKQVMAVG